MLTEFDRRLLNLVQTGLPLSLRPYQELANQLGVEENIVISRLVSLKEAGYIRHIGAFFDSAELGYTGTLVAARIRTDKLAAVALAINAYPGVTHNYERDGQYNLWFTLLTPDQESQDRILAEVAALEGVEDLLNLPATKKYKVNVSFAL